MRTSCASTTTGARPNALSWRATKNALVPVSNATGVCGANAYRSRNAVSPAGVVGTAPSATHLPEASAIANTLCLLCTSNPT